MPLHAILEHESGTPDKARRAQRIGDFGRPRMVSLDHVLLRPEGWTALAPQMKGHYGFSSVPTFAI